MKTISTEKAKNAFKGDLSLSLTGQLLPYSSSKIIAEKDVLSAIMDYLARCSRVAWAKRITTGRFKVSDRAGTRWMQAGFVGCSDILGQLTDGRLLAIEVKKSKGGQLTSDQMAFLETVHAANGVAVIASDVVDVINRLSIYTPHRKTPSVHGGDLTSSPL